MYGVQADLKHRLDFGGIKHELNLNVRHHYDQIRRKQWQEEYTQNAAGAVTAVQVEARGAAGNRLQKTTATAVNLQDTMKMGKVTFIPGVRTETIRTGYCDDNTNCGNGTIEGKRTYTVIVGGGSLKYDAIDAGGKDLDFFGGVHRGFSPADPRGNHKSDIKPETSIGMEVGARFSDAPKAFSTEAVLFLTKIENAVTPASIGGSGTDQGENAGKVRTMGIELSANYDPGLHKGWAVRTPMYFAATGTDAEYRSDGDTGSESIWAGAKKGNKVSYIPDFQISFGVGAIYKKISASIDANYVSEAFADGANTSTNAATDGDANERFGKIDSRLVMDASFGYQWSDRVRLFSNLKNITNEEYIVSRQPHGPRPGLPFTAMAGMEFSL
jgi:Fe(3+) dicitrate transport protein